MSNSSRLSNTSSKKSFDISDAGSTALWALLSFAAPAAVTALVLLLCGIVPFGNGTLINEYNAAWFESFSSLYRSVVTGDGVFYHLNVGFGSSFYHEFVTELTSPFLFLSLFFGQRSLAAAYSVITIVRTGAAGMTSWYMLRKCTGAGRPLCFALSCGYSLCGFAAFAAFCPSVADGAVFFPLLAVGIYNYIQASRPVGLFVYGVIFFMTCPRLTLIGILLSFALYASFYFRRGRRRQRVYKTALFAATLLCSAATNALFVVPVFASSVYYENGVFSDVKVNDLLSDLCFGGYGTMPTGGVGLCVAGLLLMGFFGFLFSTGIGKGEKIAAGAGALAVLLIHAIPPFARFFLGFGNAGGEAVNAGFMLALLAAYCTARNLLEKEGLKAWGVAASAGLYVLCAVLSAVFRGGEAFSLIAEMGLVIVACAVFIQFSVSGGQTSLRLPIAAAAVLLMFGAVHCAGAVGRMEAVVTADRVSFVADSKIKAREALEESYLEQNEEIPRFYRTRSTDGISDSVNLNRNEVDGLTAFAESLGIMRASAYGGADNFTEFTDTLFGIAHPDYGYYSKEDIQSTTCSPAYLINDWDGVLPEGLNAFEMQNTLAAQWFDASLLEKAEPVGTSRELSSESDRYKWTFGNEHTVVSQYVFEWQEGGSLYVLAENADYLYAVDSDTRSNWHQACAGGIFHLSQQHSAEDGTLTVYIASDVSEDEPQPVFMMYRGNLEEAVRSRGAQYISHRGSTVRFLFELEEAQTALTSIPFESGWEVTVNGKAVQPVELCGGLIGIRLGKGVNSIVMNYTPPYFRTSLWISAITLIFGLYITIRIEHQASRRRKVRMAFRAVELNISRMTVDQLAQASDDGSGENELPSEDSTEPAAGAEKAADSDLPPAEANGDEGAAAAEDSETSEESEASGDNEENA